MLLQFVKYLKFFLTSSNQHGVHSPFVYAYVTKCLYSKSRYSVSKTTNILLKSIRYFEATSVKMLPESKALEQQIKKEFLSIHSKSSPYDILYLEHLNASLIATYFKNPNNEVKNNTMVLIHAIHRNHEQESLWEEVKKSKQVTVTVDMFYCGAVFFRREQAKEHFKIRI